MHMRCSTPPGVTHTARCAGHTVLDCGLVPHKDWEAVQATAVQTAREVGDVDFCSWVCATLRALSQPSLSPASA